MLLAQEFSTIDDFIEKWIVRFPKFFDDRLRRGLEKLRANAADHFIESRPQQLIKTLLIAQFFLQKQAEGQILEKHLSIKIFPGPSKICLALASSTSFGYLREQLVKSLHTLLPGVHEIPGSFYFWQHPVLPYSFLYLEANKLRGEDLTKQELQVIEKALQEQLAATPPLTPALFWPYNKEESFRQIQLLQWEMRNPEELPHVSVHFQEQTSTSLEFLIHLARPKRIESLVHAFKKLPDSLHSFCHFHFENKIHFPIEMGAFSIKVPSAAFDIHESINLLYARRYVLKYLENIIGPYRDYNGGLFEKQQQQFETIRLHLGEKVPHFELFAEKLFYALHPVEKWLSLSLKKAEELFKSFSALMQERESFSIKTHPEGFIILKTSDSSDLLKLRLNTEKRVNGSHAQITIGGYHYLCLLNPETTEIEPLLRCALPKEKMLRLVLQEGPPPSLNPHYSAGDMRCRMLSKLLFEGLTRLNEQGTPELAGAVEYTAIGALHTFKLRPYCWSNGENISAVDFAASWQRALNDHHINHPEVLFSIKNARKFKEKKCDIKDVGIRVLDTDTIQIEVEKNDPYFLHKLAQPYFFPMFGSSREPKWFNGPYLIREQTKDRLFLEKNPYFWNAKRIYFEQIEFKLKNDPEEIFSLFQKGEIDWFGDPLDILSPEQTAQLQNESELRKQKVCRRFYLYFNTKHPILSSAWIRRALSLSINRSLICSDIFPDSAPSHPLLPSKDEAVYCFSKGLEQLGITKDQFPPLTFSYSRQTRREELASFLQNSWQSVLGITIRLDGKEWNHFRRNLEKRTFEICGTIQDTVNEDSLEYLERFEGLSSWNFSQWVHPGFRKILELANEENGFKEKAEKILAEEVPFTPLFDYVHLYAHTPQLEGCLIDSEGCLDFSYAYFKGK